MTGVEREKYRKILEEVKDEKAATTLWLKWKCLTDLFFLGYEMLGMKEAKDKRGRKLVDPVFHSWLANALNTTDDVMIVVPRRFMKTTWVKIKLLQNILRDPFVRQALYSSTSDLVEQELLSIKRMAVNPRLMQLFPEVLVDPGAKGTGWQISRGNQLTIWRDPKLGQPPQEAQIEAFGIGGNPVGKHFDVHIYDDLNNDKNTQTMEQLNKTREWYGYIQGVLEPGGQEMYLATPWHYEDLTNHIKNEKIFDKVYWRSYREGGQIIYSYYTEKMVDRMRRRMTPYQFSCFMECNPQPMEDQLFPPPQPTFETLPAGKYNYYISVDPAATVTAQSDETAIIVAAVNEVSHVFVVEALHFKKSGDEIAEILLKLNEQYAPRKIGIELGLQTHLKSVIELTKSNWEGVQKRGIHMPIESIPIGRDRSKYQRINLTVGSFIRSNRMHIKSSLLDLMKQMGLYNKNYSGKDDLVDALSMLFSIVDQFSYRYWRDPLGLAKRVGTYFEDFFKPAKKHLSYEERFSQ